MCSSAFQFPTTTMFLACSLSLNSKGTQLLDKCAIVFEDLKKKNYFIISSVHFLDYLSSMVAGDPDWWPANCRAQSHRRTSKISIHQSCVFLVVEIKAAFPKRHTSDEQKHASPHGTDGRVFHNRIRISTIRPPEKHIIETSDLSVWPLKNSSRST